MYLFFCFQYWRNSRSFWLEFSQNGEWQSWAKLCHESYDAFGYTPSLFICYKRDRKGGGAPIWLRWNLSALERGTYMYILISCKNVEKEFSWLVEKNHLNVVEWFWIPTLFSNQQENSHFLIIFNTFDILKFYKHLV